MLHVRIDSLAEGILATLDKVATATAMCVQVDTARHYIATLGVDYLGVNNMQVNI